MVIEKSGPWTATLFNSAFLLFVLLKDFPGSIDVLQQAIRFADSANRQGNEQMAQVVLVFLCDPSWLGRNPIINFFIKFLINIYAELLGLIALLASNAFYIVIDICDFMIYFFSAMAAK